MEHKLIKRRFKEKVPGTMLGIYDETWRLTTDHGDYQIERIVNMTATISYLWDRDELELERG